MRFLLIRHAETVWNREKRYQGLSDIPLSEHGKLQARLLAKQLRDVPIDRIFSSPLSRAYDTAVQVAEGRPLRIRKEKRFQELDFGPWDGKTCSELNSRFGKEFQNYRKEPFFYPLPGEGSLSRARLRVGSALQEIKDNVTKPNETVAIVTHGGILKLILFELLDMSSRFYRCLELGNTSVTVVDVLEDRAMLQLLNDMRHLEPLRGRYVFDREPKNFDLLRKEKPDRMKILSIDHITINVTDLEKSERFYSNVLGLEKCGFLSMEDHTLTYFKLTEDTRLELIRYLTPTDQKAVSETNRGTYRHFCIETDDIRAVYENCKAHGVLVRKSPSYVEKLNGLTMLIVDPNNVEIELIQY